jgi:hypothetical protein
VNEIASDRGGGGENHENGHDHVHGHGSANEVIPDKTANNDRHRSCSCPMVVTMAMRAITRRMRPPMLIDMQMSLLRG